MGKIYQGILGGVTGKIGNVIGSSWKGIPVLKSRPLSVANPRSSGQVAQRGAMAFTVLFASFMLSTVIKPLWDRFAVKQSGFNAFVSANIAYLNESIGLAYSNVKISIGKMTETPIVSAVADFSTGLITISWLNDAGTGFRLANDLAFGVAFDENNQVGSCAGGTVVRSAQSLSFALPTGSAVGDWMSVYLAFRRVDGTIVSTSVYTQIEVVA